MGTFKRKRDLGAVMTYIISPTRAVLVKEVSKDNVQWKLPGGMREQRDKNIIASAIRKSREETGIRLLPGEVVLLRKQMRIKEVYYPHFCVALVPEEKLETRLEEIRTEGKVLQTGIFNREDVLVLRDLLIRHRSFIREIEQP